MNGIFCPFHPLYANRREDCCTNCGQQHFGAVPDPTPPNSYCSAKPCMRRCSFDDQNIYALFKELPSKDHIGNRNPAHVLTMLSASGNDNNYNDSAPCCRAYSFASSNVDRDHKTSVLFTPDTFSNVTDPPTYPSNNQRSYLLSRQTNQMESHSENAFLENVPFIPGESKGVSDPSTTSLNDGNDIINYDHSLPNHSTVSIMGGVPISRTSLPWLDNLTSVSPSGHGRHSAIEQLLQHQASELAEMRHSQEHELLFLREEEPTSQLHDRNEVLLEKQLKDQLLLQKKHRRQLEEEEEPVKEPKERRCEDCCNNRNPSLLRIKSLSDNTITNTPNNVRRLSTCSMQHGDGAIKSLTTSVNMKSKDFNRNSHKGTINQAEKTYQIYQNVCGCVHHNCVQDVVGYNSGGQTGLDRHAAVPNTYPCVAKSSPVGQLKTAVLPNNPCECNKPESAACGSTCPNPLPFNSQNAGQFQGVSIKQQSDPWRDIRMSVLESEISEGQKTRQRIADAMAELTVNYEKDVVARTAQQREENATKAFEQRQRDAEASAHIIALQIEKDSIDATLFWLREAKIAAKERKQTEELNIKESKLQEEKLTELKHREIDLTEAAVSRQLAEQEATAVLRRMKDDDLERVRQRKHEILSVKSKNEIAVSDLTARRKMAEMSAKDVANMRKHEESEAVKNRTAIEKAIARQHAITEALAVADARRRTDYDVDSNAQRQSILKKAILRRDIEAIRSEARRKDDEDEAAASTLWRHEEDALLDQRHKSMLLEAANRRKKEEQALEAQKIKLILDLANERAKRQQTLQEQQKEAAANLKLKLADEAERKEKQTKQAEELFNKLEAKKLQTRSRTVVKQGSGQGAESTKAPTPDKKGAEAIGSSQGAEPKPEQIMETQALAKKFEDKIPPQRSLANKIKVTIMEMPLENQALYGAHKNKKKFDAKGDGLSAQISPSRGPRQKTAPMTKTQQRLAARRRR